MTSNVSSSGNALLWDGTDVVPFSICNGTCSKTTPLAAGYGTFPVYLDNAKIPYNATLRYTAYPAGNPGELCSCLIVTICRRNLPLLLMSAYMLSLS